MSKKIIIIITVLILLIVGGYIYFYYYKNSKDVIFGNIGDTTQELLNDVTKGTLPSISTNPMENKPDVNPVDAGNPIKNIKTNPFE